MRNALLETYSSTPSSPVTLRQLLVFSKQMNTEKLLKSANYVRTEIPIRLAHRIRDFQNLPFIVGANSNISQIYHLYWSSFDKYQQFPPITTISQNNDFNKLLSDSLTEHNNVLSLLATGFRESSIHLPQQTSEKFVNEFIKSRIGRRVLAQQHLSNSQSANKSTFGINPNINIKQSLSHCIELARAHIFQQGVDPPLVNVFGNAENLCYIQSHLEYILFQIILNSMQHTVIKHDAVDLEVNSVAAMAEDVFENTVLVNHEIFSNLPAINVTIGEDDDQVMFRISDQGGGISRSDLPFVWSWFTRMDKKPALGMGLPLARAYANYWNGDIEIKSLPGFGLDVYVKISKQNNPEFL